MTTFAGNTAGGSSGVEALSNLAANNTSKASSFHPGTTALDMAPFKSSCYFQMPRYT